MPMPPLLDLSAVCRHATQALQQGDVHVLNGRMPEALQHYPHAHVYGFLPAFLVRARHRR